MTSPNNENDALPDLIHVHQQHPSHRHYQNAITSTNNYSTNSINSSSTYTSTASNYTTSF